MLQCRVGLSAIKIGLENEIVRYDIRNNTSLGDKSMERQEIGVLGLSKKSNEHRVDGEYGRPTI